MATVSGCRYHKVNLKAKIYIYVNSTTQRCPNKIIKIFLIEGFFHLHSATREAVLGLQPRRLEAGLSSEAPLAARERTPNAASVGRLR
jgi:hypothetical protein